MRFDKTFEHSDELLTAALEEFNSQGYEQASINTILNKAGMSKGQFYYHFKNKEGLYLALIEMMIGRKKAFLAQLMRPEDFHADIFTIFKTQVRHSMAFATAYPAVNRFAESFLREKGNPIYAKALAIHNFEDNQAMNQLIETAYANGDFRRDLPLPFIKKTIGYLFTHFGDIVKQDSNEWLYENVEEDLTYLIDFMKDGLARQAQTEVGETAGKSIGSSTAVPAPAGHSGIKPEKSGEWDIWQNQ